MISVIAIWVSVMIICLGTQIPERDMVQQCTRAGVNRPKDDNDNYDYNDDGNDDDPDPDPDDDDDDEKEICG